MSRIVGCTPLVAIALVSSVAVAHAQDALQGTFALGPTTRVVTLESWPAECGTAPAPSRTPGGTRVEIQRRGGRLLLNAGASGLRAGQCGSDNPALRVLGTEDNEGLFVTRCATAAGAMRDEQGTYTLRALGTDRVVYQDVTHVGWTSHGANCRATVTTTSSLNRHVDTAPGTSVAPEASRTSAPPERSTHGCSPGAPARLSLRPQESDLPLGETLCLRPRLEDERGCGIPLPDSVRWTLEHRPALRGTLSGNCFQAGDRSAESEGHFEVVAELGSLRGRATVHVVARNLRELTARQLDPVGAQERAGAPTPPSEVADPQTTTRFAARALGQTERKEQRVLVGLAAALAIGSAMMALSRRKRSRTSEEETRSSRQCPTCGALYPDSMAFCGDDGSALAPMRR